LGSSPVRLTCLCAQCSNVWHQKPGRLKVEVRGARLSFGRLLLLLASGAAQVATVRVERLIMSSRGTTNRVAASVVADSGRHTGCRPLMCSSGPGRSPSPKGDWKGSVRANLRAVSIGLRQTVLGAIGIGALPEQIAYENVRQFSSASRKRP
jgi:hypothetical protein